MATTGTTIDTLQVNITANAQSATASLKSLASALTRVRTVLTGVNKDGLTVADRMAKSLNEMNGALNTITTGGIKKLQKLSNAINDYVEACKKLKTVGSINNHIRSVGKGLASIAKANSTAVTAVSTGRSADVDVTPESSSNVNSNSRSAMLRKMGVFNAIADKQELKEKMDALRQMGVFSSKTSNEVKKLNDEVDKAGKKAQKTAGAFGSFLKSIGRIALYRAIRSALKAITQAFSEGLHNAYYFSKQTGDLSKLAETLDRIKSVTSQMVNQLGSFWGELIQFAAPALEWIANKVREIVEYLTEFFAALNGDSKWKRAVYVEKSWDDATDKLKEYKHQLLGLDEINNLSKNKDNDKVKQIQDALGDFEYVDVSSKMKGLANNIRPILKWIKDAIKAIWETLTSPWGLLVGGAILTFFSSHKLVGIGMMALGAIKIYKKAKEDPDGLYNEIQGFMEKYRGLFIAGAIGLTVVGAALLFTGHYALGIGCILSGVAIGATTIAMTWKAMYADIEKAMQDYRWLFVLGAIGLTTIGAALLFTGQYALGLGCVLGGVAIGASAIAISWDLMYNDIKKAMMDYKELFFAGAIGLVVAGCLLLFTEQYPLGLSCLISGGVLGANTIAMNWDLILDNLKAAWNEIKLWFLNNVKGPIAETANWIEQTLMIDINRDGKLGGMQTRFTMEDVVGYTKSNTPVGVGTKQLPQFQNNNPLPNYYALYNNETKKQMEDQIKSQVHVQKDYLWSLPASSTSPTDPTYEKKYVFSPTAKMMLDDAKNSALGEIIGFVGDLFHANGGVRGAVQLKAAGGIPSSGSMFIAGEAGAEFVGNIGNTSAVANTGQMTDAIFKAAYMGMSKALKENGGGMNGYEPATMDDLFIAMKKKASNYNKRTGNPAFA